MAYLLLAASAMATAFHEAREALSEATLDLKRAIDSMMEELEAIDWYAQRAEAASDPMLRDILRHHRREEIEHFVMLLEWVRRRAPDFDAELRERLFRAGDILEGEKESSAAGVQVAAVGRGDVKTLGSLRREPA